MNSLRYDCTGRGSRGRAETWVILRGDGLLAFFGGAGLLIFLLELIHAPGGVDQLLAAGKERVAVGADFNANVALVRGTRLEHVAAGADYIELVISGVNTSFHFEKETFRKFQYSAKCKPPCAPKSARG